MGRPLPIVLGVIALTAGVAPVGAQSSATVAAPQARAVTTVKTRPDRPWLSRAPDDPELRTLDESLAEDLRKLWASGSRRGTTAMLVMDATTGQQLFAAHEDRLLNPASNVKLLATATALRVLGPDWRYQTRLLGPAPDAAGLVEGDVYLLGSGDPTFDSGDLRRMAQRLAEAGVKQIEGRIVLSDQPLRDQLATPSVAITVTAMRPGEPPRVTVSPATAVVEVVVKAVTRPGRRTGVRVAITSLPHRSAATDADDPPGAVARVTVSGHIAPGHTRRYHPRLTQHGPLLTGHALRAALDNAGVNVTGSVQLADLAAYTARAARAGFLPITLAQHESVPVRELIARINKPSNNFLADRLLMTVGQTRFGGPPGLATGVKAVREWLESIGVDTSSIVIDTGSGLSYATRLSPVHLVRVLRAAAGYLHDDDAVAPAPNELERSFLDSLAVAGEDGTLRSRYRSSPTRGKLLGKTGTLRRCIALAGFVTVDAANSIVFAIVTNGHNHNRRDQVRLEHRRIAERILEYLSARASARAQAPDLAAATPRPLAELPASPK
jgi:serine-type D-Ala-D-Ala carboxypeptidase/endopeptidase (penicillin-binding protein 4)